MLLWVWLLAACRPDASDDPPPHETDEAEETDEPVDTDAPEVVTVTVTEGPRERVDPLVCRADGEAVLAWTVDGEPWSGLALSTEREGDTVFPGYTRAGQTWTCTATLGEAEGAASTVVAAVDLLDLDPLLDAPVYVEDGRIVYRGPLADREAVSVRYGFDGWSARERPSGATWAVTSTNDTLWGLDADLTRDEAGWTAPIEPPSSARAVHFVFAAGDERDDNGGFEYTWDLAFPSVGPYLTWGDGVRPDDGIVVHWEAGIPGLGLVEYGPDAENVAYAVGSEVATLHHVAITGLPSDTSFVYRVRDASGRASPWASFATARSDADDYVFLVASDMQDPGDASARWAEVAAEMRASWPEARFVVAPGDLAANDVPGRWWLFFEGGRELFANVPIVPAVGNHDTPGTASNPDTTSYRRWFDREQAYERLDYGRTRLFALSSEDPGELVDDGAQDAWMKAETSALWDGADREVDWAFAQFHHPAYDVGHRFAGEVGIYRPITAWFDGNVDLVFQAHEHVYQRFLPLAYDGVIADAYGLGPDEGVAYLVTPAAGSGIVTGQVVGAEQRGGEQRVALAWPELAPDQIDIDAEQGFLAAEVTPDRLVIRSIGMGRAGATRPATEIDQLVIER